MSTYSILLPNEKSKTIRYVTFFILLMNCIVFGFVYFNSPEARIKSVSLTGMLISIASLSFFLVHFFTGKLPAFKTGIAFIILSLFWIVIGNYLLASSIILFTIFGYYAGKKFIILFDADKITYPSFPVKYFYWKEVNNVVLKDRVLTIDLENNKLIQSVIEKSAANDIDELQFNEFCKRQIAG